MIKEKQRIVFGGLVGMSFLAILIYNFLTPLMSDDLLFDESLYRSIGDIFREEYHQYMTWNGRSVLQIILKIFSLLPKWESSWAKWLIRYLTVHFYGAMLYFVGFYVLLLFDVVLNIQAENLMAITQSEQTMAAYLQNSFFSAGYLMAASIVAMKCLNLVPDLAAWMIPEGETAFSTRNFGEGVAQQAKMSAQGMVGRVL